MKIEGLGDNTRWSYRDDRLYTHDLKTNDLKVGMTVNQNAGGFVDQHGLGDRGDWIITDVLGDGKFKATSPLESLKTLKESQLYQSSIFLMPQIVEN